jgi:iron complex transport system substrate-binding protein
MRIFRLNIIAVLVSASLCMTAGAAGITLTDQVGRPVTIPHPPVRIISLAPNITEILFAVGAGGNIVGVAEYSDYPPEASKLPLVGTYIKPNIERIISLRPDLVIATADGEKKAEIRRLADLGIPVYVINPKNLSEVVKTVREIGRITGYIDGAEKTAGKMEARIKAVRKTAAKTPAVRVLLVLSMDPLITAGEKTFQNELITAAGGINIAAGEKIRYPTLSMEEVIVRAPEVIIMTSMTRGIDRNTVLAAWSRFSSIPAVKKEKIFVVDSDIVDRPSPRIVDGLEALARLFHPESF